MHLGPRRSREEQIKVKEAGVETIDTWLKRGDEAENREGKHPRPTHSSRCSGRE